MGILFFFDQQAVFFQPLHNRLIGLKDLFSLVIGNFGGKFAGFVHRADDREIFIISTAGLKVVLSEAGGDMDDAGTRLPLTQILRSEPGTRLFL